MELTLAPACRSEDLTNLHLEEAIKHLHWPRHFGLDTSDSMNADHTRLDRIAVKRASSYHLQGEQLGRNDLQQGRSRSHPRGVLYKGAPRAQQSTLSRNTPVQIKQIDPVVKDEPYNRIDRTNLLAKVSSQEKVVRPSGESNTPDFLAKTDRPGHTRAARSQLREAEKPQISKKSSHSSMSSASPESQSDSDMESESGMFDDSKLPFLKQKEDYVFYENVQRSDAGFEEGDLVSDLMKHIEIPKKKQHPFRPSRTQQKLDDMKSFLGDPSEEQRKTGLANFNERRQNEALSSQWSQIRLRFSNRLYLSLTQKDGDRSGDGKARRTSVECRAGILGSLHRLQGIESRPVQRSRGFLAGCDAVSQGHASEYLQELWNFGETEARCINSQYPGSAVAGTSLISPVIASSDEDVHQSRQKERPWANH